LILWALEPWKSPPHPLRFAFQVDISPKESPAQVMFGHVSQERNGGGKISSHGFAIRLDLATGEIWDLLNESGLIGMVEEPETFYSRLTDEEPMLLSWEVEHLGTALIPGLHIGDEEWLYPALTCPEGMVMDTLASAAGDKGSPMTAFFRPDIGREVL